MSLKKVKLYLVLSVIIFICALCLDALLPQNNVANIIYVVIKCIIYMSFAASLFFSSYMLQQTENEILKRFYLELRMAGIICFILSSLTLFLNIVSYFLFSS